MASDPSPSATLGESPRPPGLPRSVRHRGRP